MKNPYERAVFLVCFTQEGLRSADDYERPKVPSPPAIVEPLGPGRGLLAGGDRDRPIGGSFEPAGAQQRKALAAEARAGLFPASHETVVAMRTLLSYRSSSKGRPAAPRLPPAVRAGGQEVVVAARPASRTGPPAAGPIESPAGGRRYS